MHSCTVKVIAGGFAVLQRHSEGRKDKKKKPNGLSEAADEGLQP